MTTFALIHGAWHGSWCWERVVPLLERAGHRAIAVDLPSDDPAISFVEYADGVIAALASGGDDVVLVAHSMGGLTAPLVAARRPVRHIVYVCSLLPLPGKSLRDRMARDPDMLLPIRRDALAVVDEHGSTAWVDEAAAVRTFFHDCEPAVASAAVSRLRPQATTGYRSPAPALSLSDVPSTYVVCAEDAIVNPEWSRRVAHSELQARVEELPGGHSPFLSRPRQLADVVLQSWRADRR